MLTRIKRWARDTAIILAVSLGLFATLELLVRLIAPQSLRGTSIRGEHFSAEDSILGFRYVPGAVWRFRHPEYTVDYAINSAGFRDTTPHPVPKPPGTRRVLLLGDSFTFGQGVNYADTWPVIAERNLSREGLGHVDLVKAGVQGMDTRTEYILMRRHARQLEVNAVVVGFLINDIYTTVPYEERPDTEAPDSSDAWARMRSTVFVDRRNDRTLHLLTLTRRLVTSSDAAYINLYLLAPDRGGFLRLPLGDVARRQLAITEALFDRMVAHVDSIHAPLVVISIPQQFQVLYARGEPRDSAVDVGYYDRHFAQYAARRGFTWISTLPRFMAADSTGVELFYRLDGHLTPAGNRVVANAFLQEVLPLLERSNPAPGRTPVSRR